MLNLNEKQEMLSHVVWHNILSSQPDDISSYSSSDLCVLRNSRAKLQLQNVSFRVRETNTKIWEAIQWSAWISRSPLGLRLWPKPSNSERWPVSSSVAYMYRVGDVQFRKKWQRSRYNTQLTASDDFSVLHEYPRIDSQVKNSLLLRALGWWYK